MALPAASAVPAALMTAQRGSSTRSGAGPLSGGTVCCGYVGQGARPAAEYHECDFDWHEHAAAVRHIVEAQREQAMTLARSTEGGHSSSSMSSRVAASFGDADGDLGPSTCGAEATLAHAAVGRLPAEQGLRGSESQHALGCHLRLSSGAARETGSGTSLASQRWADAEAPRQAASTRAYTSAPPQAPSASTAGPRPSAPGPSTAASARTPVASAPCIPSAPSTSSARAAGSSAPSGATSAPSTTEGSAPGSSGAAYDGSKWEEFYRAHPSARFFKERRYLLLEFPALLTASHVAEIGCGCGSSILPVLKANPGARTTCTDISTTCLDQLLAAADAEGIARERLAVFPADATDPAAAPAFAGHDAGALLIMFTLSAVPPESQAVMLRHAWAALAPGGLLMIRDHGLYDMVQLRIPADQWVGPNLYKRGDGTMAYFFSVEVLSQRALDAGFRTVECKYVTVVNRNRKTGMELRRVFVHGVFEKLSTS